MAAAHNRTFAGRRATPQSLVATCRDAPDFESLARRIFAFGLLLFAFCLLAAGGCFCSIRPSAATGATAAAAAKARAEAGAKAGRNTSPRQPPAPHRG